MAGRQKNRKGGGSVAPVKVRRDGKSVPVRDTWRLRVVVNGRQVQKTHHGRVGDAWDELHRWEAELLEAAGKAPAASPSRTVETVLEVWFNATERKASTAEEQRRIIDKVLVPAVGDVPVIDLTTDRCAALIDSWRAAGLSGGTVRNRGHILSGALAEARRRTWIPFNPMEDVKLPTASKKEVVIPTREQVRKILAKAQLDPEPAFGLFVRLMAALGTRPSELIGLRWANVDLDGTPPRIRISETTTRAALDAGVVEDGKTERSRRFISLDSATVQLLKEYRDWQPKGATHVITYDRAGGKPSKSTTTSLTHAFKRVCRKLGPDYEAFSPYSLRHWIISEELAAGEDLVTVAVRHGHSTNTMLARYAHYIPGKDAGTALVAEALLAG